ncbi:hypothetical protein TNCT_348621, partial [Trichonephila clavata]
LTDEERCSKLSGLETQIQIFDVRKDYVLRMIEIDKKNLAPLPETMPQLESELKNLEDKINFLEGKTIEFLPCPIAICKHNYKFKAVKRPADPILRPSKLTARVSKNLKNNEFSFPKNLQKTFQSRTN